MSDSMQSAAGAFSRLTSREQVLVVFLAVVLLLFAVGGIYLLVGNRLAREERRLQERRDQLQMIEGLEGRYRQAEAEQNQQRQKLQRNPVQLFSLLNKTAHDLGMGLDNLNERTTPIKEAGINEISVDVTLKGLSITKLNKFLEKLEGPPNTGLVKVTKLKAKTAFADPELLDVSMTVATYRLQAGATPGAEAAPAEP
ncbi:MAG: type II secretion system protein M [Deltaproteobacteria bacterium]|nr:type II secretion system protein M [Deltaproteobacteria bacterium]